MFGFQGVNEGELGEPYNILCSVPGAENALPSLSINSANDEAFEPDAEVEFTAGEEVTLTAMATDFEDGDLSEQVVWNYTPEGQEVMELGEGASISFTLPESTGTLTATVSDSAGEAVSSNLVVTVLPAKPDRFLDVTGSATCSLRPEGGSFNANLLFTDAEGNFVSGEVDPTSLSFNNLKVLNGDGTELTNATLSIDNVLSSGKEGKTASILILLDQSGSITGFDREGKRFEAAKALVERLQPGDEAAIAVVEARFSSGIRIVQNFTTDKTALNVVLDANVQLGDSSVYSSLRQSADLFDASNGEVRAIITITDGETFGDTLEFAPALARLAEQGIKVFPVGVRTRSNTIDYYFQYLKWTACSTGGLFTELNQPDGFDAIFGALANELVADGTPLATTLSFDSNLPSIGSYTLQGSAQVMMDGRTISKDISVPFELEPVIPGKPVITSLDPASGPTQTSGRAPNIKLSGENLYLYWRTDMVGRSSNGAGQRHEFIDDLLFALPATTTSNAGPQPLTVTTPFGTSEPFNFTYIAEYTPTIESFTVDKTSLKVGETVTYSWQVDDLAGDAISCEVQANDGVRYQIEDCRTTTSQTHTFTALPNNSSSFLRIEDENGLKKAISLRVNVQPSAPAPMLESLSPAKGPAAGGNVITITGQNLTGASRVMFDGADTTDFNVDSDTQITATVIRGVNSDWVTVFVPEGGTSNRLSYKYVRTPIISSLSPAEGLPGDTVTVSGSYIGDVEAVNVGAQAAEFTILATNKLTFVVPEGEPGVFNVTLSAVGETSAAKTFTYLEKPVPAPVLNSLSPNNGSSAGGTSITLNGENLTDALSVNFGGQDVSFTQDSGTQISVVSPAGKGSADVTVTTAGGVSNALSFGYIEPPVLSSISPNEGPTTGGTEVTLTGDNLSGVTEVKFGNFGAQSFTILNDNEIRAVSPKGVEGVVDISVQSTEGLSGKLEFHYMPVINNMPVINSFSYGGSAVTVGDLVTFTWSVEDADKTSLNCVLRFRDDSYVEVENCGQNSSFSYAFEQAITYDISLTVRDMNGATAQQSVSLKVAEAAAAEIAFSNINVQKIWTQFIALDRVKDLNPVFDLTTAGAYGNSRDYLIVAREKGKTSFVQVLVSNDIIVGAFRISNNISADTVEVSNLRTSKTVFVRDISQYQNLSLTDPKFVQLEKQIRPVLEDAFVNYLGDLVTSSDAQSNSRIRSASSMMLMRAAAPGRGCIDCSRKYNDLITSINHATYLSATGITLGVLGGIGCYASFGVGCVATGLGIGISVASHVIAVANIDRMQKEFLGCVRSNDPDLRAGKGTIAYGTTPIPFQPDIVYLYETVVNAVFRTSTLEFRYGTDIENWRDTLEFHSEEAVGIFELLSGYRIIPDSVSVEASTRHINAQWLVTDPENLLCR